MNARAPRRTSPAPIKDRRTTAQRMAIALAGPVVGFALLLGLWKTGSLSMPRVPPPEQTLSAALRLFSDPFHDYGGHDIGIAWNIAASLGHLLAGYTPALMLGLPAGIALGRLPMLSAVSMPVISLFRPVSPLAWLPFGLLIFQTQQHATTWAIFVCSLWPVMLSTAEGIRKVPRDYMNVGKVLGLSEWRAFKRILLPSALPNMVSGARQALGSAWIVTIAAEMFMGGRGMGSWLRHELVSLNGQNILIAILVIGGLGLLLDLPATMLKRKLDRQKI